ncbi:hypothetical protein ACUY2G_03705 [Corynebacterium guaraldiae]|nr:hypothetical protein [Corynebacterium sp. HMSC068H04]HCT9180818.1 hypothetical protein [Corynebacterium aurimucosum]
MSKELLFSWGFLPSGDDGSCKEDAEMKLFKVFTLVILIAGALLCIAGLFWETRLTNLGLPMALLGIALSVAASAKRRSKEQ